MARERSGGSQAWVPTIQFWLPLHGRVQSNGCVAQVGHRPLPVSDDLTREEETRRRKRRVKKKKNGGRSTGRDGCIYFRYLGVRGFLSFSFLIIIIFGFGGL